MIIDKNYVLKRINFYIYELNSQKEVISSSNINIPYKGVIYKVYSIFPSFFKDFFIRPFLRFAGIKKLFDSRFFMNKHTKFFAIDFLLYFIVNQSNKLDLDLYFNSEDKKEIIKFIDNKILMALFEGISKDMVYDKKDKLVLKKYEKFQKDKIEFKSNNTVINLNKKKYCTLPVVKKSFIQSFFHRYNLDLLPFEVRRKLKGSSVVDCGAYIGDSALILNQYGVGNIYCFEPDSTNMDLLKKTIKLNSLKNVIPLKMGVGKENNSVTLSVSGTSSFVSDELQSSTNFEKIDVVSIDSYFYKKPVGLIKMDIEGYELDALLGAEKVIKENKPVLIICLYHKGVDVVKIPPLLKNYVPEYTFRFFNLNHKHPFVERVLVAYI